MVLSVKRYVVFELKKKEYHPFEKTRGPITLDRITEKNVDEVVVEFPHVYLAFKEMLDNNDTGVFVRHNEDVVGYMWRKDYDTSKTIKSDGYLPLAGKCSHLHWARVKKKMQGRGLQLLMLTWLISDAYKKGIENIYTDIEIENNLPVRGMMRIGFKEKYRLVVFRTGFTWRTLTVKYAFKKE